MKMKKNLLMIWRTRRWTKEMEKNKAQITRQKLKTKFQLNL